MKKEDCMATRVESEYVKKLDFANSLALARGEEIRLPVQDADTKERRLTLPPIVFTTIDALIHGQQLPEELPPPHLRRRTQEGTATSSLGKFPLASKPIIH